MVPSCGPQATNVMAPESEDSNSPFWYHGHLREGQYLEVNFFLHAASNCTEIPYSVLATEDHSFQEITDVISTMEVLEKLN